MGHASRTRKWLEVLVRAFIVMLAAGEGLTIINAAAVLGGNAWTYQVTLTMTILFFVSLFLPFRKLLSRIFTVVDGIVSLRFITGPRRHGMKVWQSIVDRQVFQPTSIPHLVGLTCFVATFGIYALNISTDGVSIPLPGMPVPIDQLFQYNGFGLVFVSACGVGIFVARKPKEVFFERLGWKKPTAAQVGIGLALIAFTFGYDYVWSLFTHQGADDMASKIAAYNSGTFAATGFGGAAILALATAICAGVGEETLARGALQPVFGIAPAAILHGVLHAQFSHAPVLIVQIAIWSCCMGIVRRFTNTTTTIIGHAGYNLCTTFLFAFNPG